MDLRFTQVGEQRTESREAARHRLGLPEDEDWPVVLLATGAWGFGNDLVELMKLVAATGR